MFDVLSAAPYQTSHASREPNENECGVRVRHRLASRLSDHEWFVFKPMLALILVLVNFWLPFICVRLLKQYAVVPIFPFIYGRQIDD